MPQSFFMLWTSRHSHAAMKGASAEPMSSRTTRSAISSNSVGSRLMIANRAPLRRNISTEDAGNAVVFLCSDLGKNVTGEILHVDAGLNVLALEAT